MSVASVGFAVAALAAGCAVAAAALLPLRLRTTVVGALGALCGVAGTAAGAAVLAGGRSFTVWLPDVLPFAGVRLALDPLGAVFVVAAGVVAVAASIYAVGYCRGHEGLDGRAVQVAYPLFVWALVMVPAAASVSTFLVLWELMAVSSLVLVVAEHRHDPAVRSAGLWYGAMTQLGFVAILLALLLLAHGAGGGESFAALRAGSGDLSPALRSTIFLAGLVGFGSKAGVVPLHVWLPRAHPEAPSHVSGLLSGAMVKLGVYGIVRLGWDLLGGGPAWWGVVVLAVGATSALFGILHALMASDLKRLLAYSTTENVGLILVGVGASGLFAADGRPALSAAAAAAALLWVVNHAVFKGLLFLGAGSVLRATGLRDLDRLGGLVRRMPVTAVTFAVGACAVAALPPLNGFVGEWLLLQSLVHGLPSDTATVAVTLPLAVAAVALTGGLAVATFVKAFGTGFLAMPRSTEAATAREVPRSMRAAMVLLATTCVGLALAPSWLGGPLGRAVGVLAPLHGRHRLWARDVGLELAGVRSTMSPLLLAVAVTGAVGLVAVAAGRWSRRGGTLRGVETWGCGRSVQTARMEYTATSFAEPLQRVFDDVLRPDLDVESSHRAESRYYLDAVRYRRGLRDGFETWVYRPVIALVRRWGEWARWVQSGSIHQYLAYVLAALVLVLVVAR